MKLKVTFPADDLLASSSSIVIGLVDRGQNAPLLWWDEHGTATVSTEKVCVCKDCTVSCIVILKDALCNVGTDATS